MLSFFSPYSGIRSRLFPLNIARSQKICWNNLASDNLLQYLFNVLCAIMSFTNAIFGKLRWIRLARGALNWSVINMKHSVLCAQCTTNNWLSKIIIRSSVSRLFLRTHSCPFISHYCCLLCGRLWLKRGSRRIRAIWKAWVIIILKRKDINTLYSAMIFSYRIKNCPSTSGWEAEVNFW